MLKEENQKLIEEFTKNYVGKLFYFCLKRTDSIHEAEDLTQEISLNIIEGFHKGTIPVSISAWVWSIARNRYCIWADRKRRRKRLVEENDISDFEIAGEMLVENEYIRNEDILLLRRELAFISSDYRDIIVAYYVDDRSTKDIANSLNLPLGTVKSKLFRARNILKEGMNMAREFGVRSYKPEVINFAASGSQPSGLPWCAVNRKVPKNILLSADNNPSTIEELAIELGIALPYMEEEVNLLVQATLLKKIGNKYITSFFIMDKECQTAINEAQLVHSQERSELIDRIVMDSLSEIRSLNIVRNKMTDDELKWFLVPYAVDVYISELDGYDLKWPESRESGERWGFIGYEENELYNKWNSGNSGNGTENAHCDIYQFSDYNMWNRAGIMTYNQVLLLADLVKNNRNINSLSEQEKDIWKDIAGRFAYADAEGRVIPAVVVMEGNAEDKMKGILKNHLLFKNVMENLKEVFDKTVEILRASSSEVLERQLFYCASMQMFPMRMMTIHDEVEHGRLLVPEDTEHSTVAMCITIK